MLQLVPNWGFTEQQIIKSTDSVQLTNAALNGAAFTRPKGAYSVCLIGSFILTGGAGGTRLFLEGSNDGTNWVVLGASAAGDLFTATSTKALNSGGNSSVDVSRFTQLRARAAIVSGAPTFTIDILMSAIQRDAQAFLDQDTLIETSLTGTARPRRGGTRFVTAQAVMSALVLGAATSVDAVLQGSPDTGTTWVEIGRATFTGNGAAIVSPPNGGNLVDLGPYGTYRMIAEAVGGAVTSFVLASNVSSDDGDAIATEEDASGASGVVIESAGIESVIVSVGVEGANAIDVTIQLQSLDGSPLTAARTIEFIVYDTALAGVNDLATNATVTAVTTGTLVAGSGTNRVTVTTDATGTAVIEVTDAAAETIYGTVIDSGVPKLAALLLVKSAQATLTFA